MINNEKVFDQIFKYRGGILPKEIYEENIFLKKLKSNILGNIAYLKSPEPNLAEVYFDFTTSSELNAAASKFEGKYFIGINAGTCYLVHDMFLKMFSSKDAFQNMGNFELETEEKKLLNASLTKSGIEFQYGEFSKPLDNLRFTRANDFAMFAMTFLVFHELAHIVRGHLDYIGSKTNSFIWNEIDYQSFSSFTEEEAAFSQTIEMDADSLATNRSFALADSIINNPQIKKDEKGVFKDWDSFTFCWVSAIYSLFRLFGFSHFDISKAKTCSHPPPAIRIGFITSNISTLFHEKYNNDLLESILSQILTATIESEKAFLSITFYENSHENFTSIYQDESLKKYFWSIIDNWKNVRPLLEPHAYGKLPPVNK